MTKMTSRQYREKLIDEVKRYPVLYDTRHENHRDIDFRDRCWSEISDKLGANSEVLKREWKILRDSMRQALKRNKSSTKAGAPCKKWRFQSRMAFILPHMTMRRNQRHMKDNDVDIKLDGGHDTAPPSDHESEPWDPGHAPGHASHADHDSLDLFFASVCQSTKRLPKKFQNTIKRQVLDVLLRVEDEFEIEQVGTKTDSKNF